jgi:leucyl aminopeptidase
VSLDLLLPENVARASLAGSNERASDCESLPLWLVSESELGGWLDSQPAVVSTWIRAHGFAAERTRVLIYPGEGGQLGGAVLGLGPQHSLDELTHWSVAGLPDRLPPATFRVAQALPASVATAVALGWLTGAYRMNRYRAPPAAARPRLIAPANADVAYARSAAGASALARDLINTPANDLGPAELSAAVEQLAIAHGARFTTIVGRELLEQNFPLVHAVGSASPREPRLLDLRWGNDAAPRVTLVGKGVCFDTGGLDLKPSAGMLLMKKDMGGAAVALGLARMLMEMAAPVSLRLLIPAVENSVAGNAYRPGDVLRSRRGLTVEIGNTDAEGRLVLADALAEASASQPQLLLDFATLTGAARTALGPELPAVFSGSEALLERIRHWGQAECDPVWPLPLWAGYDDELSSRVADLGNVAPNAFAGSIMGALFLQRFVADSSRWAHFDLYAWNPKERPGRPVGAEAQCMRLAYRLIRERFG